VVVWPFKYTVFNTGKRELFNLGADPDENRDLAGREAKEVAQLSEGLSAWVKTIPKQARQTMKLSPEEKKRLESLGYVGGGAK
jgi:hypothetical protein